MMKKLSFYSKFSYWFPEHLLFFKVMALLYWRCDILPMFSVQHCTCARGLNLSVGRAGGIYAAYFTRFRGKTPSYYTCLIHRIRNATVVMLFPISYFRSYILVLFISCVHNIRMNDITQKYYIMIYTVVPMAIALKSKVVD